MTDPTDPLLLDNQLCFALYAATHAITRSYRGLLADVGLTYPQYLVLLALMQTPVMTVGSLARELQLDAATLTPLLKRLEAAGLVGRQRRAGDERVVEITLTAEGRGLRHALARIQADVSCQTGLSEDAIAGLRATLHDLTGALHRRKPEAA